MTVLDDIMDGVRADLAERQARVSLDELKARAAAPAGRARRRAALRGDGVRSSPRSSGRARRKGALAAIADPAALAADYEAGGAAVISVLTEQRRFGGSLADLEAVRARRRHPRAAQGLHRLAATSLGGPRLRRRPRAAHRRGARAAGAGVARRARRSRSGSPRWSRCTTTTRSTARSTPAPRSSASTRATSRRSRSTAATFARVAPLIPDGVVRIAESGVRGPHDLIAYANAGADAVLVGEVLVTGRDPRAGGRRPGRRRRPSGAQARSRMTAAHA